MLRRALRWACLALVAAAGVACSETTDPAGLGIEASITPAAPSPLQTVASPFGSVTFWPFTGVDYSGTPQDPLNVLFAGHAQPSSLRAALMSLDGDRTLYGFPDAFPFNCTWNDAIGGMQTSYGEPAGWVGSAIQLECGVYSVLRFHIRFFDIGDWTLGGAHFETLIPGTTSHQVLSWELAEQLVIVDFMRSGLLDPMIPVFPAGVINPSPYGEIPTFIYNELPPELRAAIGGPPDDQSAPVPIGTDGAALILNVADEVDPEPGVMRNDFVVQFDQTIPKPFCVPPSELELVHVAGPLDFRQRTIVAASGHYVSQFHAEGSLTVTPVDPTTMPPTFGEPYRAHISEHHMGVATDKVTLTSQLQIQALLPRNGDFGGRLMVTLLVGPQSAKIADLHISCDQ
jgi:hypothetical protein